MLSNIFLQFENLTWIFVHPANKCPVHFFNSVAANTAAFLPAELLALFAAFFAYTVKKIYKFLTRKNTGYYVATTRSIRFGAKTYTFVTSSAKYRNKPTKLTALFSTTQMLTMYVSRFILRALVKNKVPVNVAIYFVMPLGTILWVVLLANNLGMLPFAFALTSQLSVALTCSALIYFTSLLLSAQLRGYSLVNSFLPAGTPAALYPVLILIEIVSHASRFISLGVRLAANILAGHLLVKVFAMGVNYVMLCMTAQHPNRLHHHNVIRRYITELNWLHADAQRYLWNTKAQVWFATPRHKKTAVVCQALKTYYGVNHSATAAESLRLVSPRVAEQCANLKLTTRFVQPTTHNFVIPWAPNALTRMLFRGMDQPHPSLLPHHTHTIERQSDSQYHYTANSIWHFAARYKHFTTTQRFRTRSLIAARARQLTTVRNEWHVMISSISLIVIGLGFLLPIIIMETAVASLQAYVFFHLSSMYISEAITAKH